MKYILSVCNSVLCLLIVGCNNNSETPSDVEALKNGPERFNAAANAGDFDALAAMYTEDAVRLPPHQPMLVGNDAIRNAFKSNFEELEVIAINTARDIRVFGDSAFVRGDFTGTFTPKSGGEPTQERGKWIGLWKRQPDSSWKIEADIFNSDLPESGFDSPADKASIKAHLKALSDRWSKVALTGDIAHLERIWAPDFSYVRPDGTEFNKQEGLAERRQDSNTYTEESTTNFKVKLYGSRMAVTNGDYRLSGQDKDGQPITHFSRFTNVWIKKGEAWQCVSGHASNLN